MLRRPNQLRYYHVPKHRRSIIETYPVLMSIVLGMAFCFLLFIGVWAHA